MLVNVEVRLEAASFCVLETKTCGIQYLSLYLPSVCMSVCMSVYLFVCLSGFLSVCVSVCLVCLFVSLFVFCSSVCLSVLLRLSIYHTRFSIRAIPLFPVTVFIYLTSVSPLTIVWF